MKKIIKLGLVSLIVALSIIGCSRTSPLMNVPSQEVSQSKTQKDVFNAIKRAGAGLGWIVSKSSNGVAVATLNLRTHQAVITIKYSAKDYSIDYKTSTDLDYNQEENTIHSNYNGWILNLNNAILVQLSL